MSKIQAVIFDLDDTLFLERDYVRSGYRAVAMELAQSVGKDLPFEQWMWNRFLAGQSAHMLNGLNDHFGLGLSHDQINELVEVYRNHRPQIMPLEDLPEFLGRLHEEYRLGVLSDGYLPVQRYKFEALGLRPCFEVVLFTEQLGRASWKPSTDGFEWIARKLNLPHEALAYVGDNPAKDFVAPNLLGWRTIQLLHPGQLYSGRPAAINGDPQRVVRWLGDLRQAIRE